MKEKIIFILFLYHFFCFSQKSKETTKDFLISYQVEFKNFLESEDLKKTNALLIVNNQGSFFTYEAIMNLAQIQKERELGIDDLLINKVYNYHVIKNNGEQVEHFETIGSDTYRFKETLDNQWLLINQDSVINGTSCKKAQLDYAGRKWIAWYNPKIPITFGPYKLHGLPGLIMNVHDTENIFNFTVSSIKQKVFEIDGKMENYFIKEEGKSLEDIDSATFYQLRNKFYQMSTNQRVKYMNRNIIGGADGLVGTTLSGEKINMDSKPKTRNFIERFE